MNFKKKQRTDHKRASAHGVKEESVAGKRVYRKERRRGVHGVCGPRGDVVMGAMRRECGGA